MKKQVVFLSPSVDSFAVVGEFLGFAAPMVFFGGSGLAILNQIAVSR